MNITHFVTSGEPRYCHASYPQKWYCPVCMKHFVKGDRVRHDRQNRRHITRLEARLALQKQSSNLAPEQPQSRNQDPQNQPWPAELEQETQDVIQGVNQVFAETWPLLQPSPLTNSEKSEKVVDFLTSASDAETIRAAFQLNYEVARVSNRQYAALMTYLHNILPPLATKVDELATAVEELAKQNSAATSLQQFPTLTFTPQAAVLGLSNPADDSTSSGSQPANETEPGSKRHPSDSDGLDEPPSKHQRLKVTQSINLLDELDNFSQ